jgi:uncharacterized protein (DUF433 family)
MKTERIEVNPRIMAGKPVIEGTRIPVYVVLGLLESEHSMTEIVEQYPDLELEDVKAAIRYATDIVEREDIEDESAVA